MKQHIKSRSDKTHNRSGSKRSRSGLAATELAIILPVMLVIIFGGIDLARVTRHYMVLCNAVRTGAEYGATERFSTYTYNAWQQRVTDVVNEELQEISDDPTLSNVTVAVRTNSEDNYPDTELVLSRVEVDADFTPTFSWPGLPTTIHIEHHVHFRQFR